MRKNRDAEYLDLIRAEFARDGVIPSYRDLAKLLGLAGSPAIVKIASRLIEAGYLVKKGQRLAPGPRFHEPPTSIDADPARTGDAMPDGLLELTSIDRILIDEPLRTVLLRVGDDSMREAGILEGDLAVVKRGAPCEVGDTVAASVDGGYIVRHLEKNDAGYFLRPAVADPSADKPSGSPDIVGKVTGVVRTRINNSQRADHK